MNQKRSEQSRWQRIVLPASIVLNLFFVAVIGGYAWQQYSAVPSAGIGMLPALAEAESVLSREDAAIFDAIVRRDMPRFGAAAKQLKEAREAMGHQVMTEPFNAVATHQAFQNWAAASRRFQEVFSGTLIEALSKISPEGRRKLVDQQKKSRRF
jgi:hypothetical protein